MTCNVFGWMPNLTQPSDLLKYFVCVW